MNQLEKKTIQKFSFLKPNNTVYSISYNVAFIWQREIRLIQGNNRTDFLASLTESVFN